MLKLFSCQRYDPSKWHLSEGTFETSVKQEFGMWLNHAFRSQISFAIEDLIKKEFIEVLKSNEINTFDLNSEIPDDDVDSDPLADEEEEDYEEVEEEEEQQQ